MGNTSVFGAITFRRFLLVVLVWLGVNFVAMGPVKASPSAWFSAPLLELRSLLFVHALTLAHLLSLHGGALEQTLAAEALAINSLGGSGRPIDPEPIATIDGSAGFDAGTVAAASRGLSEPVLIRNAVADPRWSLERFQQPGALGDTHYLFQCDADVAENLASNRFNGYHCTANMSLRQATSEMRQRGLYMRQNNRVLLDFPELRAELGIDDAFEAKLGEGLITVRGVFMGIAPADGDPLKAARGSSLHTDLSSNWYVQAAGRKTWTLVDPRASARLLPLFDERHGVPALFSRLGYAAAAQLAPTAQPLTHFPRKEVTLTPGDALYVPTWWWHEITNELDAFNAAVALRGPRAVVKALLPNSPAFFATVGSLPDIGKLARDMARNRLAARLGSKRTVSFEDNFLAKDVLKATAAKPADEL